MEEGKTENFRSALELLKMIDGALDGRDIKEDAEEEKKRGTKKKKDPDTKV